MTLTFCFLLVNHHGQPVGDPDTHESEDANVAGLAKSIKRYRAKDLSDIPAAYLTIWKLDPPLLAISSAELFTGVKALHLDVARNRRGAVVLYKLALLGVVFPSNEALPLGHLHIIVQLPQPSQ